jgi:LysR family transcriptional regulator, transcriptional activator of the cysJI operon
MDLAHLSTFCTVVEAGSISRAAKELFVTQPAISLKIQELEEHYQVQLLDRTNKGISPTEVGLFVYGEAQKVIALIASIEREIKLSRNPIEELTIGASSTIGNSILPCTLLIYRGRNPGYSLTVDIGNTLQIMEKLVSRRVEIALVEGPINLSWRETLAKEDISIKKVAQTRLILVAGKNGQYRETTSLSLEELTEVPLIMREEGSGIRTTFEQVVATKGLSSQDFNIIYEMSSGSSITSAVASDMGLALLPVMALRKELRHKILKNIGLTDIKFKHDFNLLYRNDSKKLSYRAFIDLVCSKERGFC